MTAPVYGQILSVVPESNGRSAEISFLPDNNFTGSDIFEMKVVDPFDTNASDTIKINIDVSNVEDAPVFTTNPVYTDAVVGYNWYYEFEIFDGDPNSTLNVSSSVFPSWLIIEGNSSDGLSFTLHGTPVDANLIGTHDIQLVVEDETGTLLTELYNFSIIE